MYYFCQKNADFLQKDADISKINGAFVLKGIFSETTYVYVLTCHSETTYVYALTCQVYSITLTSFRQGVNITSSHLKQTPKKPTEIRVKMAKT